MVVIFSSWMPLLQSSYGCGASNPREIQVQGRDAKDIYFTVDFLGTVIRHLLDGDLVLPQSLSAEADRKPGKHRSAGRSDKTPRWFVSGDPGKLVCGKGVIVIGGGDTGNDCVLPYDLYPMAILV